MADFGYIILFAAFLTAAYSALVYAFSGRSGNPKGLASARNGLIATFGLVSLGILSLLLSLLTHDFSLEYVASYSDSTLPLAYLISGLWAGNAGSLLFWAWTLALVSLIVVLRARAHDQPLMPYAGAVLMLTEAFFLLLLIATSDPFARIVPPADGRGLNPLLQNPGMIIHPPALLAGYVILTVPFAFAMSALLTRNLDDGWTVSVRRWMLAAWLLLGAGNLIGAWWAYVELGWGGYWAWDPVENAGLMPWLVATAFLHSGMMQRRRGMFKVWNVSLVILAFILSIFGTFLTRSNILSSVHTFGDLGLEPYFTVFLLVMLVWSFYLVYDRRQDLRSENEIQYLVSRENSFQLTNWLLLGATFIVLLGTVFPALSEVATGVKIEVTAPFFNRVNVPIFVGIILLAGVCTMLGWRRVQLADLSHSLRVPAAIAVVVALGIFIALGVRQFGGVIAYSLMAFVVACVLSQWVRTARARRRARKENYASALWNLVAQNRPRYGAYLVHMSLAVMAIGVIGSSLYSTEKEVALTSGQSVAIQGYTLTYQNTRVENEPDKRVVRATMAVERDGQQIATLFPEKLFHRSYQQPVTEVAIWTTLFEDLYVILIGWEDNGSASFKVIVNPLVNWIWIGGVVVLIGGLLAFWPERRKAAAESVKE